MREDQNNKGRRGRPNSRRGAGRPAEEGRSSKKAGGDRPFGKPKRGERSDGPSSYRAERGESRDHKDHRDRQDRPERSGQKSFKPRFPKRERGAESHGDAAANRPREERRPSARAGGRPFGKPKHGQRSDGAPYRAERGDSRDRNDHRDRQDRPERPGQKSFKPRFPKPERGAESHEDRAASRPREERRTSARAGARPFGKPKHGQRSDGLSSYRGERGDSRDRTDHGDRHDRPERSEHKSFKPRFRERDRAPEPRETFKDDLRSDARPSIEKPVETEAASTGVQTVTVLPDESGMRIDRFLEAKFPGLSFSHIQRVIRKGQLRVDGKRREPKDRLEAGQAVRIPPLRLEAPPPRPGSPRDEETREFLKSIILYEDDDVMVLNKPAGLAVQGGSGTTRHIDGMLGALTAGDGQRPRLVHRLDKETSGCLLVAKNRFSAAALAKTFRSRSARKIYWALVPGVPKPKQGRISTYLVKEEREDDSVMRVANHGEEGASHAITYYAVVETAAQKLSWMSLKPVTGRTHQLRVQLAHIHHPIVGDPKYFSIENWELPGGLQNRLHLLARRIAVPHPRGGTIDVTAPLPPHMQQSWNLLGFDAKRFDPIEEAPEE